MKESYNNVKDGMTKCERMGPSREEASKPIGSDAATVGDNDARAKAARSAAVTSVKGVKSGGGIEDWMGKRSR